jgi:ubiquinone/menaquinone biosynthesis C-methylase UbiE
MKRTLVLVSCLGAWLCLAPTASAQPASNSTTSKDSADAKRERDLKIPEIVRALEVKDGSNVADIGAGSGFYELSLSRAAGKEGRVYAEDIDEKGAIKRLNKRVHQDHLRNMKVILGTPDDPKLPAGTLDGVLMIITYHEIADHQKMLEHIMAALKPGGRFVVVDMTPHKTLTRPRADQTKNHVIDPTLAESEIHQAGFEIVSRDDHFIDNPDEESTRWMIVFRKPPGRP